MKTTDPFVSADAYERFVICGGLHAGAGPEDELSRLREQAIAERYPTSTAGAILELRGRGYDATVRRLQYACDHGRLSPAPRLLGHERVWTKPDIERWAALLRDDEAMTPEAAFRWARNIDGDTHIAGKYEAQEQYNGAPLCETIYPDGRVVFTPAPTV